MRCLSVSALAARRGAAELADDEDARVRQPGGEGLEHAGERHLERLVTDAVAGDVVVDALDDDELRRRLQPDCLLRLQQHRRDVSAVDGEHELVPSNRRIAREDARVEALHGGAVAGHPGAVNPVRARPGHSGAGRAGVADNCDRAWIARHGCARSGRGGICIACDRANGESRQGSRQASAQVWSCVRLPFIIPPVLRTLGRVLTLGAVRSRRNGAGHRAGLVPARDLDSATLRLATVYSLVAGGCSL